MKRCLIYHVFNTLTEYNLMMSLESLMRQDPHERWDTFLVWNSSASFSTPLLLERVRAMGLDRTFGEIRGMEPTRDRPQSSSSDFLWQFQGVDGHDLYLVAKGDFYLARGSVAALTELMADPSIAALCVFKKYDLREYLAPSQVILFGERGSYRACREEGARDWDELDHGNPDTMHVGAIGYQGLDGVMHAYTDPARALAHCDDAELQRAWGACSIYETMVKSGCQLVQDDRIYALHVFHEIPQKNDRNKLHPGYRY